MSFPKKKSRRSRTRYPALDPTLNLKTRYELIADYDYLDKLSPEELKFLNDFTDEYANANLDSKDLSNNYHNTEKLKKDCYKRNNDRNACIYTRAKAGGSLQYLEELKNLEMVNNEEDRILSEMTLKKHLEYLEKPKTKPKKR